MKAFGERRAVDRVDLALAPGECLAVLGPNGAGKTTLLRMVATLVRPDAGRLVVLGHTLPEAASRARAGLGYLGHDPAVYLDLTCWQNLELFCDLHGVDRGRVPRLLDRVGLLVRAHDRVRDLSRGMTQRLGLARLLLSEPRLLLLDEPHSSLDAQGQALLDEEIRARAGRGVVLVTHDRARAEALADRVLALAGGRAA